MAKVAQAMAAQKGLLYPPVQPPRNEWSWLFRPDPNPQAVPLPEVNEWAWLTGGQKTPEPVLPPSTPYHYYHGR